MYKNFFKRTTDLILAIVMSIPALPIMGICALLIKAEDPKGGVFFRQKRIGKNNKPFTVLKFRSMKIERFRDGRELADSERMLKIGGKLRKLSLDELPQLFNIIKGDMSFIGPRPLPVVYYPYFTDQELHRHDVMPGISGLAQVNGRNNLSWDEKFKYDLAYINSLSLSTDLTILISTINKVISKSDVQVRTANVKDNSLDEIRQPLRAPLM